MTHLSYEIRTIAMGEWLPDGCMGYGPPVDPALDKPGSEAFRQDAHGTFSIATDLSGHDQ